MTSTRPLEGTADLLADGGGPRCRTDRRLPTPLLLLRLRVPRRAASLRACLEKAESGEGEAPAEPPKRAEPAQRKLAEFERRLAEFEELRPPNFASGQRLSKHALRRGQVDSGLMRQGRQWLSSRCPHLASRRRDRSPAHRRRVLRSRDLPQPAGLPRQGGYLPPLVQRGPHQQLQGASDPLADRTLTRPQRQTPDRSPTARLP